VPVTGLADSEETESGFMLGAVVIFWERLKGSGQEFAAEL
jgi:hypothetical protein